MVNYLRLVKGYIVQRKIRSLLTIIGVFIGITAVFSLISIGQGAQEFINEQFEIAGSNRISVQPGGGSGMSFAPGSSFVSAKLYDEDVEIIKKSRGVEFAFGVILRGAIVEFRDEKKTGYVLGVPTDSETIRHMEDIAYFEVDEGRNLRSTDHYSVVLGYETAFGQFIHDIKLGDKLVIDGVEFSVVGITKKTGNPFQDRRIAMPIDTVRQMYGMDKEISLATVTVKDGFDVDAVAENIRKDLRRFRNEKEGEEDFSVTTSKQLIETFQSVLGVITLFIIGIAAISLLVGSVGIMNSMYTSVLERTRDIGIMKAVGARNGDIIIIFLAESGILGLVGGIAGVIFGAILGKGAEIVAVASGVGLFRSYITIELVAASLSFSFLVGALSGFFPAMEASRLKPVDAFRYKR